ncbi:MAG: sulfatase-like hydrolase/transferase [Kiritimatiellae bacterium]|nr:sulfatase-like hydrolase/transferase [Kiritimatiellia bacterium]
MTRPNILLITSDQQHWNTLGCSNPEVRTPNLDKLAGQGTRFTRAYCPNPTCTPTRASIITGQYPSQHGAWSLGTKLSEKTHTVGDDFRKAGYRTALVGKAHFQPTRSTDEFSSLESMGVLQDLDFWRAFNEPFYGFEHVELARNHGDEQLVGQHYAIWMEEKGCTNWRDYFRQPTGNAPPGSLRHRWPIPEEYHYDNWISERTNALMERYAEAGDPFFLWASFFDPHPPYLVPEPWDTMYDPEKLTVPAMVEGEHDKNPPHFRLTQTRNPDWSPWKETGWHMHGFTSHLHDRKALAKNIAVYYGMISLMDRHIGLVLDKLDALGLADNTLVVFTTDHGHFYGHHGLIAKGAFHYEDMIRIPFLVRYPGRVPAGKTSPALQSLVDLAQSLLGIAGIPAPRTMTGVNQSGVWFGQRDRARDQVIVENRHEPTTIHVKTYVDDRYKITVYYNQPYGELFDLQADPGELNNLWDEPGSAGLKARLTRELLFAEMGKEPLWMPRVAVA